MSNKNIVLGECPVCGGEVRRGPASLKGYGCSNFRTEGVNCKFVIWENFYGKKITDTRVKALLEKGKTPVIKGWTSRKTGKDFDAALKLEKISEEEYRIMFDFDN